MPSGHTFATMRNVAKSSFTSGQTQMNSETSLVIRVRGPCSSACVKRYTLSPAGRSCPNDSIAEIQFVYHFIYQKLVFYLSTCRTQ